MSAPFTSYAQNGEDVVLWRALGHIENGYYVDIGANDPTTHSVTRAFYDRGWTGVEVEPLPDFVELLQKARARSVVVQAAVGRADHERVTFHEVPGTGLSSLEADATHSAELHGFDTREITVTSRRLDSLVAEHVGDRDVHFCKIDVEGGESAVLDSVDLRTWRPWVLVVESTEPLTVKPTYDEWEPAVVAAGYEFCLFDGLSRFYVASERAAEIGPALSYPACVLDEYTPHETLRTRRALERVQAAYDRAVSDLDDQADLHGEIEELRHDLRAWRGRALESWSVAVAAAEQVPTLDIQAYREELDALHSTLSWRITRPLRAVRRRMGGSE